RRAQPARNLHRGSGDIVRAPDPSRGIEPDPDGPGSDPPVRERAGREALVADLAAHVGPPRNDHVGWDRPGHARPAARRAGPRVRDPVAFAAKRARRHGALATAETVPSLSLPRRASGARSRANSA